MATVQAATLLQPGEIALREYDKPEVAGDALLVKVAAVGVCGSDKHMFGGKMDLKWPVIPGHEFSGVIEAIGPRANDSMRIIAGPLKEGDRITVTPGSLTCGKCWFCVHVPHRPQLCPNRTVFGFRTAAEAPHLFGAFGDYLYVPGNSFVLKLPEGLSAERAALCEPLAVALRAAGRALAPGIPYAGEGVRAGGAVRRPGRGAHRRPRRRRPAEPGGRARSSRSTFRRSGSRFPKNSGPRGRWTSQRPRPPGGRSRFSPGRTGWAPTW